MGLFSSSYTRLAFVHIRQIKGEVYLACRLVGFNDIGPKTPIRLWCQMVVSGGFSMSNSASAVNRQAQERK